MVTMSMDFDIVRESLPRIPVGFNLHWRPGQFRLSVYPRIARDLKFISPEGVGRINIVGNFVNHNELALRRYLGTCQLCLPHRNGEWIVCHSHLYDYGFRLDIDQYKFKVSNEETMARAHHLFHFSGALRQLTQESSAPTSPPLTGRIGM
jgi:hypothetical protein